MKNLYRRFISLIFFSLSAGLLFAQLPQYTDIQLEGDISAREIFDLADQLEIQGNRLFSQLPVSLLEVTEEFNTAARKSQDDLVFIYLKNNDYNLQNLFKQIDYYSANLIEQLKIFRDNKASYDYTKAEKYLKGLNNAGKNLQFYKAEYFNYRTSIDNQKNALQQRKTQIEEEKNRLEQERIKLEEERHRLELQEKANKRKTLLAIHESVIGSALIILIVAAASQIINYRRKRFTQKILQTQELERQKISRELHDTIAQKIRAIGIESENLKIQSISEVSKECMNEIRAICYNLTPPDLLIAGDGDSLENLLEFLCSSHEKLHGIKCIFNADDDIPQIKDKEVLLNLFRIVQEALTNISKHAEASSCSVMVRKEALKKTTKIKIFITDNGKGIPPEILQKGKKMHFGLHSMRERASYINADFLIRSEIDDGTEIKIEFEV